MKEKRNGNVTFYVTDPAKGHINYTKEEFEEKWIKRNENKTSGIALILEPQADLNKRQADEKAERERHLENITGYFLPYKKSFLYLGIVILLITAMQAVLPFISKAVIDVGIQTQDVSFINIVLTANLALIISITVSSAVRNRILQHMSSHKMIEQVANARELLVKGILTTICRFSRLPETISEPLFGGFEVTNFRK